MLSKTRCFALVLLASLPAAAQSSPPAIRTNRYNVEMYQGPILAPLRVTGLGGAYGPYGESSDGIPANAAAPAVREPFSVRNVDYDLAFSVSFPGAFNKTDFNNDGRVGFAYQDYVFYTLGAMLQIGRLGIGALGDFQRYNLTPNARASDPQSSLTLGRIHALAAWSFLDNQLIVGGGARGVWLNIDSSSGGQTQTALRMVGAAPQLGMLVRPDYQPWRIGGTFRAPVSSAAQHEGDVAVDSDGVRRAAGFAVPASVYLPWELQGGFAIQVGPRPLNPKWIDPVAQETDARQALLRTRSARRAARQAELSSIPDPHARTRRAEELASEESYLQKQEERRLEQLHDQMLAERRARYWNWPRQYVLVIAEALVTGPSPQAVGLEAFLSQSSQKAGESTSVSPRLGLEGEPVVSILKTRVGTYLEPARYVGTHSRQHFTFGFDIRLFTFNGYGILAPSTYRLSGVADLAPRFQNFGVSFGAWH